MQFKILFKKLKIHFFNLKERLFHRISLHEKELIKNTGLFDTLGDEQYQWMLKSIRSVKYLQGDLIVREGEQGYALFIIDEGSVRIFTRNVQGKKIPLARLNKGDYFGEQSFLGLSSKSRNANVEAISTTKLIYIPEKFIFHLLNKDSALRLKLTKKGITQAIQAISLATGFYGEIQSVFNKLQDPFIQEFAEGEVIFEAGDKADNIYLIMQGEVILTFPQNNEKKLVNIILHKGHFFGELGVLWNQPRLATATAYTALRLLTLKGSEFKNFAKEHSQLQRLLTKLSQVYQLPLKGVIEQYFGNIEGLGSTITSIYKMDDGGMVIVAKVVNENIFIMTKVGIVAEQCVVYEDRQNKIELDIAGKKITGIKAFGDIETLPLLCILLLENEIIDDLNLKNFESTGRMDIKQERFKKEDVTMICLKFNLSV